MRVNITALVIASALLVCAAVAQAQTAPPNTAPATPSPAHNKDDDVYCRSTTPGGSLIEKRECHTQREWKQISDQSRATLNSMTAQRSMPGLH